MKRMILAAVAALCAACAPMTPTAFSRGDADQKQFSKDDYECERDARSVRGNDCHQMDMYEKCMKSKGYQPIPGTANRGVCG